MIYLLHDDAGQISASTKLYGDQETLDAFSKRLLDEGRSHVSLEGPAYLDPESWFVAGEAAQERPAMPGRLSKGTIKADDKDVAELTGLPPRCRVVISALNEILEDQQITTGGLAITSQVPITYTIMVEAFPHKRAFFKVEAVA